MRSSNPVTCCSSSIRDRTKPVLEGARADVVRAQTRLELATTDFTRGEALFAIRGISQEEFDRRVQARKEAEAALIVARAAERVAALNVEFTRVRAPIGGRIAENLVSVGNVISGGQAGSTVLTTIVAVDPIQFVFDASEADYLKYNRMNASGERRTSRDTPNPVRIRLLDEPTFTHVGKMDFVDNQVDRATGTIRGRALVPNPGGFLTPGQFGRLQLLGSGEFDALLVPDSAILSDQSQRFVWTVGKDDIPEPRVVEPGNLERGLRIVRAGLQRDDRIVINGMQRVRPWRQGRSDQRAHRAAGRKLRDDGHGVLQAVHRPADSRRRDLGDDHAGRRRRLLRPSRLAIS